MLLANGMIGRFSRVSILFGILLAMCDMHWFLPGRIIQLLYQRDILLFAMYDHLRLSQQCMYWYIMECAALRVSHQYQYLRNCHARRHCCKNAITSVIP